MNQCGTKKLETNRLILRQFELDDAELAFKNWTSDSEVTKFLTWQNHKNLEETKKILEFWTAKYNDKYFYLWAIELKETGEPIGSFRTNIKEFDIADVGYCIGKNWWNRRLVSEALLRVVDFLFSDVKINRIESRCNPKNIASAKVMERCGLRYEGTMRQAVKDNTGIVDSSVYAILSEDY